ncbi:hypothetical protein MQX03_16945 [Chryseobacterium aahli]|uniref:hypothetical protein n=1 Tax=Chryseobacterium aahli TaxID=1278643 RepID=UPI001F61A686|nr:hypothetical protein [Chryseobacterium aahli]MCI3938890.1 hypothetical protein [Chryseobacterium aahli]
MEENANYIEVQEWFDGSNMEPSKVDGVIYIIIGSKYYRRRFSNSTVNPLWWGIKDDGNPDFDTTPGNTHYSWNWDKMKKMVDLCVQQNLNIHFPKGQFSCGNANFPLNYDYIPGVLKDLKNIIISGEGRDTVLRTDSQTGADVLLLHSVKNITLRDFAITATVAIKTPIEPNAGSNGVSLIDGFDNITLENIHVFDLEGVEYSNYIDGAKAFTIQNNEGNIIPNGKLKIINCSSKNNAYGWRHDGFLSDVMKDEIDIDIDLSIEKSWHGFSLSFGEATESFDEYKRVGYKGKVTIIDCQQDIFINRLYGGNLNFYIQSDKTEGELKTNPLTNQNWKDSTTIVDPFNQLVMTAYLAYVKHSNIKICGYKKINHFKYAIGAVGWIIEPYTEGRTENSNLLLQVDGDIIEVQELKVIPDESVTDPLFDKAIYRTTIQIENFHGTIPQKLLEEENENLIICNKKIISPSLNLDRINFGDYASASLNSYGGVKFKQTLGSHGNLSVIEAFSNTDERLFSINNFGELILKNSTKIVTGDSLPNGNIFANKGSVYLRKSGEANHSIWLKTVDSTEFGWKLIPIIENCTTANRPNLTLTEDIGKMIFDTDLGCHIAWTGTKWIKYSFTDA